MDLLLKTIKSQRKTWTLLTGEKLNSTSRSLIVTCIFS